MPTGAFGFSTSGPETFGDFILTHLNPALAFLLNPPVTCTANYAVAAGDGSIIVNSTAAINLTLPASSLNSGRPLAVKTIGQAVNSTASNVVPLGSTAAGTVILAGSAGRNVLLRADGTNWVAMAGST